MTENSKQTARLIADDASVAADDVASVFEGAETKTPKIFPELAFVVCKSDQPVLCIAPDVLAEPPTVSFVVSDTIQELPADLVAEFTNAITEAFGDFLGALNARTPVHERYDAPGDSGEVIDRFDRFNRGNPDEEDPYDLPPLAG